MLRRLLRLALGARLPVTDGTLRFAGPKARITIRRDAHGVPYIEAENDDDAHFALGFAQAQDRAFQLELYVRVARGTLAEVLGDEMLPVDRLMRRIGLRTIARAQLAALPEREQAQLDAFVRGVHAAWEHGLPKRPHELVLLGAAPTRFEAADVLAVLQFFAFALSSNWDAELARLRILRADGKDALLALEPALDPDAIARLARDADALLAAEQLAEDAGRVATVTALRGASNAFAIAPMRSATGRPILACDPHLSPALPAPWWLVHVRTPRWTMRGACLPSQPVVSFGNNEHVAWGITAGHVDNTDLFVERIGSDGASAREGTRFVPCTVREETIEVKGKKPVVERVLVTPRGPIVTPSISERAGVALSMRGTWMAPRRIGGYAIREAKSVAEAIALYASYPGPSENRVFADRHGAIARQVIGDAPKRRRGSGMLPVPGWDDADGWEAEPLAATALPGARDPAVGFVVVANQDPGPSPTGDFLGADWLDGSRHARLLDRLATRTDWDLSSAAELQCDRRTVLWPRLRAFVLAAAERAGDRQAQALLRDWDGEVGPASAAASLFELFFAEMMVRVVRAKAPRSWRAALGEGTNAVLAHGMMALRRLEHLVQLMLAAPEGWFARGWEAEAANALEVAMMSLRAHGPTAASWRWGDVRPLVLEHPVGTKKPLDRVWSRGPYAFGGDATTVAQGSVVFDDPLANAIGVPNLRMVLDVGAWETNGFVLAGGQSANPCSPHYDDQIAKWLAGESITLAWTDEAIRRTARTTLVLDRE
jgi:penicillin amidase